MIELRAVRMSWSKLGEICGKKGMVWAETLG